MLRYENECVGCPPEMGCLYGSCPMLRVPHLYCDRCGTEVDELFLDNDGEYTLCEECLVETTPRMTIREAVRNGE